MDESIDFWNGVTKANGNQLTDKEKLKFCKVLNKMLVKSPEVAKIFYNTQVYNEIVNDVTTRGEHSVGVAIVAEKLASQKAKYDGKSKIEQEISGLLAKSLGYMHDLGHTPFGHDGESALNNEMERFEATRDYKEKREKLYGKEYVVQAGDLETKKMCYEHNETSAIISEDILKRFANENGYIIDENAMQYMKTGILAHSTSRVKQEPKGDEQKAVRLADKVAYIPQDELDLLKQGVLKIDDLTPEEQSLLGLDENTLTAREQIEYESYPLEERENYKEEIRQSKLNLKEQLRNIDIMPEFMQKKLFQTMDSKIHEMQAEIASKCFVKTKDGEIKLDGRKSRVDFYEKVYKNGKPKNRELTDNEKEGSALYKTLREAQKMPARNQEEIAERKLQVDKAAKDYRDFLAKKEHINPMLATLWVTKAKYQDSFIRDEFPKVTQEKDGQIKTETLNEINKRNENGWKMKSTFQFFYSNIEQIPPEFRDKYTNSEKGEMYTDQQIVSVFIASFTNNGLDELYNGLLERNLVISRADAISEIQEARPDIDVKELVSKDMKLSDSKNPEVKHKIAANDILEYLYEQNSKSTIVAGKNGIPPIEHRDLIENMIEANKVKNLENSNKIPDILLSVQDLSKQQINSKDIQLMVASVMERQNTQEIQKHIDEVNKSDEGR